MEQGRAVARTAKDRSLDLAHTMDRILDLAHEGYILDDAHLLAF